MTAEIQNATSREPRYTISIDYMPDGAIVQCVTVRNNGMDSQELGEFVRELDMNYQPLKMIIINNREDES